MKIAFVFPGQGSQSVGMGSDLGANYPAASKLFEQANSLLGYSISSLCADGPIEELSLTKNTQPAIYTTSVATLTVLLDNGVTPDVVAGHSVGEYAAVVASGAMSWEVGLELVQQRARTMDWAANKSPGAMAAILGLDFETVGAICRDAEAAGHGIVDCANVNSDAQIVISGEKAAVDAASALAIERGAKRALPLAVSGGFHSRIMINAAEEMAPIINSAAITDARIPIVANVTSDYEQAAQEIKANLITQIDHSVLWDQSIKRMIADGVNTFVEVGSGKVLAGLLKRVSSEIKIYTTGDIASLQDTIAALGAS